MMIQIYRHSFISTGKYCGGFDKGQQIYCVREFTEKIAELAWKYGLDESETGNTPTLPEKKLVTKSHEYSSLL